MTSVTPLAGITLKDRKRVGGKCFVLVSLLWRGQRVPAGLCITCSISAEAKRITSATYVPLSLGMAVDPPSGSPIVGYLGVV